MWLIKYLRTVRECLFKDGDMSQEKMDAKLRELEYEINKLYLSKDSVEDRMQTLNDLCEDVVVWCDENA